MRIRSGIAGAYLDPETNTYYLRTRSCNSETGRFQAEDSVHGITRKLPNDMEVPEPSSLNRYTYAHNNPNYYQDPSGHFVITTGALVIGGMALLGAVLGGIAGNYNAEQMEVAQKDRWRCVVARAATGAAIGVIGGTYAAPTIVAATGISGISVSSAGISTITAGTAWATGFEQARQLVASQNVVEQTKTVTRQAEQMFKHGELYEATIKLKDSRTVDVLAEVVINGKNVLLNHIAIYPQGAEMTNEVGMLVFRQLLQSVQLQAYQAGFTSLSLHGERVLGSSSANPGMIIDRTFDLIKLFGG